jgi:hypothetical protein
LPERLGRPGDPDRIRVLDEHLHNFLYPVLWGHSIVVYVRHDVSTSQLCAQVAGLRQTGTVVEDDLQIRDPVSPGVFGYKRGQLADPLPDKDDLQVGICLTFKATEQT